MEGIKAQRMRPAPAFLLAVEFVLCVCFAYTDEAPQLIKVNLKGGYLGTDVRYEKYEKTSPKFGDYDRSYLQIQPKVSLDFEGSLYHPNLLDYDLTIELGQNYEKERLREPAAADPDKERSDKNSQQFYSGHALILKEKKLSAAVLGSYNLIRRDNGFFTRETLYLTEYGAELDYAGSVLPWSVTTTRREEEETDSPNPRSSKHDELNFRTSNQRGERGRTKFSYLFQDFNRKEFGTTPYDGTRNSMRLTDLSNFLNEIIKLNTYLYYNDIDSSSIPSSTFTLREQLTAQHTPDLQSTYQYSYARRDSGSAESTTQNGFASLNHQLYDSLNSTVTLRVSDTDYTSQETFRYGLTLSEAYSKRIGDSAMLNLGVTITREKEDRKFDSSTTEISNEPHILTALQPTLLNQPNINLSSIVVTDPTGTILYSEGRDYDVFTRGTLTEIARVVGGDIPEGGGVLVSYSFTNAGSGSFYTDQEFYRFRYSLFERLISIYGHFRTIRNSGSDQFITEDLNEFLLGVESSWKWFNAGAEYEDLDSSLAPTKSFRCFQGVTFNPSWRSQLRLTANQSWISYTEDDDDIQRYFHNMEYRTQLTPKLSFIINGSLFLQRSSSDDTLTRDMLALNTELRYSIGKTFITATYEYRDEDSQNETILENSGYLKVRRNF